MSQKTYSMDLRLRVIEHIKLGSNQKATSVVFKVSKSTVGRWWLSYKEEGSIAPKVRQGSKGRVDPENLKNYVIDNENSTLVEIGSYFKVSACSIYRRLKKLGFSYKKKPSPMWKQVKKSELSMQKQ